MCECKCIYSRSVRRLQQLLDEAKAANAQYEVDLDEAQNLAEIYREERDDLLKRLPQERPQSNTTLTSGQEIVIKIRIKGGGQVMGWCSGTDIFDEVVQSLKAGDAPKETLKKLAVVLEDHDWDCQNESKYWDDPDIREIFQELHPSWFEDEN